MVGWWGGGGGYRYMFRVCSTSKINLLTCDGGSGNGLDFDFEASAFNAII